MGDGFGTALRQLADQSDPRLREAYWRTVPAVGDRDEAVLVGVVHDHPASIHRAQRVVQTTTPDVLALELPELAIPYFERNATHHVQAHDDPEDDTSPVSATDGGVDVPPAGGEMSAAIAAAGDASVVAVDTFDWRFFLRLARSARERDADAATLRTALADVGRVGRHALGVRVGDRDERPDVAAPTHDVDVFDHADDQADDERAQLSRTRSLHAAFERPPADLLLDETREAHMAANVDAQRETGRVVAVVGMTHLDEIADRLATAP